MYKVEANGKIYEASKYQEKIFDAIKKGTGNMIINASAGSSKTTTIVNAIKYIPEKNKILFLAFNKDIVTKIKTMVTHPNTNVMTFHSLGYSILLENKIINNDCINEFKYQNYITEYVSKHNNININGKKNKYIDNIKRLVSYSRYYLKMTVNDIKSIAKLYCIELIDNECQVCREVLLWGKEHLNIIDYTDMIWLPNVLNLNTKKNQYNWIFVDEAQDTSIAEQCIVEKTFKRGSRFVIVGDEFQQINVWAGSTTDAIIKFKSHNNTNEYFLPISYRCPKNIVKLAQQYSTNIIADENAIDGVINYKASISDPNDGDMVLCRITAPLVQLHLKFLQMNKKSYIRGYETIRDNYINELSNIKSSSLDRNCLTNDGVFPSLWKKLIHIIDKTKELYGLSYDDVFSHKDVVEMYDTIIGLRVLSEGCNSILELKDKVYTIFSSTNDEGIQLSTIHRSKGLEADNIYIYCPSLLPSPLAKAEWEVKTEHNLIYVAYTRAKKTLNFIPDDNKTISLFNLESIKKTINEYKTKLGINENLNKKSSPIFEKTQTIIKIGDTMSKQNQSNNLKNKKIIKFSNLL